MAVFLGSSMVTLVLGHFIVERTQAFPVISGSSLNEDSLPSCNDLRKCRTIWNIIWSCITTIVACTWVAVHPNVPGPRDSWVRATLDHMGVVAVAVIAPEFIILWAARQWFAACNLEKRYQRKLGWTQAHGFCATMGGFMVSDNGRLYPLPLPLISTHGCPLITCDEIDSEQLRSITQKAIKDKSKSDVISKGLVIIQTGWFVMQCIARGAEHLPITELEIVTLAYATLNFVIFWFWWHKPFNVLDPFVLVRRCSKSISDAAKENENGPPGTKKSDPFTFEWLFNRIALFIVGVQYEGINLAKMEKVPTFYSCILDDKEDFRAWVAEMIIGVIFGGIHCIAWSFSFPSSAEQTLWRVSSIAIISVPTFFLVLFVSLTLNGETVHKRIILMNRGWKMALMVPLVLSALVYLAARIALLVLAFMTLRSLPPGAYHTVHWTTFIPHI